MKIPFKMDFVEGNESVMELGDINPTQIRFNHDTKEIFIAYEPALKYAEVELMDLHWSKIKRLVIESGGEWVNVKAGIHYLLGVTDG